MSQISDNDSVNRWKDMGLGLMIGSVYMYVVSNLSNFFKVQPECR